MITTIHPDYTHLPGAVSKIGAVFSAQLNLLIQAISKCAAEIFSILAKVLQASLIGSKTFSLLGIVVRLPVLTYNYALGKNKPGSSFRDLLLCDKGYHRFEYQNLSKKEAKHYLLHASAAAALHRNEYSLVERFGFQIHEEIRCDSQTGLKMALCEKGDELLVVFDGFDFNTSNEMQSAVVDQFKNAMNKDALFKMADKWMGEIKNDQKYKDKKITLTGQNVGGALAQYVSLKQQIPSVVLNSFSLDPALQKKIGTEKLLQAVDFVTHIISKENRNPLLGITDFVINFLGIKTAGNFGKKVHVPSVVHKSVANREEIINSLFALWKPKYHSHCSSILEGSKSLAKVLTDKIRHDFKAAPIKVSSLGKKETMLKIESIFHIFELMRKVLMLPFVGLHLLVSGAKVRLKNLSYSDTGVDSAVCNQKTTLRHLTVLDTPEASLAWKKALVENAKHSVEISGYCGGKPFLEILQLLENKIRGNEFFKARIMTNTHTMSEEDKEEVKRLSLSYPGNFEAVIINNGLWTLHPDLIRHEDHVKMVIADQCWCVMGGTSLNNQLLSHGEVTKAGGPFSDICDGTADIDLASKGEIAQAMKQQFDQLWSKWKRLLQLSEKPSLDTGHTFEYFTEKAVIEMPEMHEKPIADKVECQLILSMPEQGKDNFGKKKLLKMIEGANKEILIANMSLNHKEIIRSLKRAIKRGISVKVITNGNHSKASFASKTLSPRNRVHYKSLMNAAKQTSNGHFEIREYGKHDILFHPKVMIVDRKKSVTGSFNIERESVVCDDDLMVYFKSKEVGERLVESWERFSKDSILITSDVVESPAFAVSVIQGRVQDAVLRNIVD